MKKYIFEHHWSSLDRQEPIPRIVVDEIGFASVTAAPRQASILKAEILKRLQQRGWSGEVEIDPASSISITSIKDTTGLCFQTGNMARMYADLMKLQTVYIKGVVRRGIFIIPTKTSAKILGSNIANFDRLTRELTIFESVITMPILVIGIE